MVRGKKIGSKSVGLKKYFIPCELVLIIWRKLKSISLYSFWAIFCSMFSLKISKHFFFWGREETPQFSSRKSEFSWPKSPSRYVRRDRSSSWWALLKSWVLFLEPPVKCSNCVVNSLRWGADSAVVPARGLARLSWSLGVFVINMGNWREQKIWAHMVVWLGGQNNPFLRAAAELSLCRTLTFVSGALHFVPVSR